MNLYIENKSIDFIKKSYKYVSKNTNKTVFKVFVINHKGILNRGIHKFFIKKGVYDIEYVLEGPRGLNGAIKCLNLSKNPISLTLKINKPLNKKTKKLLLKAKKTVKIIDKSNCQDNINFYNSFNKILYKTDTEDKILDADIMHIYKFYEPVLQCKFSSCLGNNLYVDKNGNVYFCPHNLEKSMVGKLGDTEKYFSSINFENTLKNAIQKRNNCKTECAYFDFCMGACPLEDGCCNFPDLFIKNSKYIDDIIDNGKDLSKENYITAKIVLKDVSYGK